MSLPNRFCYRLSSSGSRLPAPNEFYRFDFVVYSIYTQHRFVLYYYSLNARVNISQLNISGKLGKFNGLLFI